jgi:hypothetical protein
MERKDLALAKVHEEYETLEDKSNAEITRLTGELEILEDKARNLFTDNTNLHADNNRLNGVIRDLQTKEATFQEALTLVGGEHSLCEPSPSAIPVEDSRETSTRNTSRKKKGSPETDSSNTDASTSTSSSESDDSGKHKRRFRKTSIRTPAFKPWAGTSQEENVNIFLPRLSEHLRSQNLRKKEMVRHVLPFLEGRAFQLWNLQAKTYNNEKTKITWVVFSDFLRKTVGLWSLSVWPDSNTMLWCKKELGL